MRADDPTYDTDRWKNVDMTSDLTVTSYNAPRITILDVVEGDSGWHAHNNVAEVMLAHKSKEFGSPPPGTVYKTIDITARIRDDNPIHEFPFDRQELTVEMEMPGSGSRNDTDCGRYFVPINISVANKHEMLTWNYHRAVGQTTQKRGSKQHMVCSFRITRKPWNYVINVMLIMAMTATLACLTFVVPVTSIADRSGVTLTLLLTVVAFKMVLSDTLPKVAYLTYLDLYVFACFLVIFIIALENAFAASARPAASSATRQRPSRPCGRCSSHPRWRAAPTPFP